MRQSFHAQLLQLDQLSMFPTFLYLNYFQLSMMYDKPFLVSCSMGSHTYCTPPPHVRPPVSTWHPHHTHTHTHKTGLQAFCSHWLVRSQLLNVTPILCLFSAKWTEVILWKAKRVNWLHLARDSNPQPLSWELTMLTTASSRFNSY